MIPIDRSKLHGIKLLGTNIRDPHLIEILAHVIETQRLQNELYYKKQDLKNNIFSIKLLAALEKDD